MFARDTHALLGAGGAQVVAGLLAQEGALERHHARVREEQGRVPLRDQRRARHPAMSPRFEESQERLADLARGEGHAHLQRTLSRRQDSRPSATRRRDQRYRRRASHPEFARACFPFSNIPPATSASASSGRFRSSWPSRCASRSTRCAPVTPGSSAGQPAGTSRSWLRSSVGGSCSESFGRARASRRAEANCSRPGGSRWRRASGGARSRTNGLPLRHATRCVYPR